MPTVTPSDPQTWQQSHAALEARFNRVQKALDGARAPDGSVDLRAARAQLGKDLQAARLLHRVQASYFDYKGPYPVSLTATQARQAAHHLDLAKRTMAAVDQNDDGVVQWNEVRDQYGSWAGEALRMALLPEQMGGERRLRHEAFTSLAARQKLEALVEGLARHHCESPEAALAVAWSFRKQLVQPGPFMEQDFTVRLNAMERNWQRFLPFVGEGYRSGQGHLSDAEVARYLGTSDFGDYVARAKQEVNARVLMDYEREWLTGADLR